VRPPEIEIFFFDFFFSERMDDTNVEMQSVIQSSPFGRARYWLHRCES
jgi:hypothetical protein